MFWQRQSREIEGTHCSVDELVGYLQRKGWHSAALERFLRETKPEERVRVRYNSQQPAQVVGELDYAKWPMESAEPTSIVVHTGNDVVHIPYAQFIGYDKL